ncbi:polysaccharide biosynthesis tyrosine autokinase [Phormidium sp. CCY1219]|uniref:polysaccharide biosynthesis tyrosine autokinase n=1 Tax=Phormidium sp. CCY1219 TaxID=2886104 RepID=UPI002D1F99C7|nr:hypothetical protein [Phormidium sp. CCY1219]MEB3826462.1 AAA family ATPase [Phormidium sp. CCY1219]
MTELLSLTERAAEVIGGDGVAAPLMTSDRIRKDSSLDPARQQLAQNLVGLQTEKERLRQQLNLLVKRERELSEQFKTLPNKQKELARLAQQVQLHQGLYNKMQGALADAKAAEAETVSSLNVANEPYVSKNEVEGNSPIVVFILGGIVGILVGNAVIFVLSLLEGKCYTKEEVQNALQQQELRILGILPQVYPFEFEEVRDLPVIVDPDSPYLEFYEKFRTNLLRVGEKPPKVLLMSSVAPKEGKTFCAYNLAIAAARAGKRTLLIETDLRSPTKASALNVTLDPETHLEPLSYYGQLNQCIRLVPEVENLYIVPSPGPVRNSAALLESYEVQQLLKDARVRFDMVILDSPALNVCNDAFLLEPFSDGMVMVTRPLVTEPGMLTEYVEPLTESETVQLLGAVVNGADIPVQFPEISGMQDSFNLPQASDAPRPSLEPTDAAHHAQLPTLPRR